VRFSSGCHEQRKKMMVNGFRTGTLVNTCTDGKKTCTPDERSRRECFPVYLWDQAKVQLNVKAMLELKAEFELGYCLNLRRPT